MNLIVVVDKNWAIGCGNRLLFSVPEDMKFFREKTLGKVVVMGGRTFRSLPNGALKGRINIVLTRSKNIGGDDVIVCNTLTKLFIELDKYNDKDIFIIGGGMFYHTMLPCCDTAYITKIDAVSLKEPDTFFPKLDRSDNSLYWHLEETSPEIISNGFSFTFNTYKQEAHITQNLRKLLFREHDQLDLEKIFNILGIESQKTVGNELRQKGAYYTSEENIKILIKPLFLDQLEEEFERAKMNLVTLEDFHRKISGLKFLDPACGCGNFLMVAYKELRLLELKVLKAKVEVGSQDLVLKVNLGQFFGIEIEESLCDFAKKATLFIDQQMNVQVLDELEKLRLPHELEKSLIPRVEIATIVNINALQIDWGTVVPRTDLSYILGNPPFVGYFYQSKCQKEDMLFACTDDKGKPYNMAGKMDYVAAWYFKAAKFIANTPIRTAFVSTNSITQGEQAAAVWEPLFEKLGIQIDFAHRTFKWKNEAKGQAAVHCVIIGFSARHCGNKYIFDGSKKIAAKNINHYLLDVPNIFLQSRSSAICDSPIIVWGSKPVDGGNLIIEADEYDEFVEKEPGAKSFIRRFVGAKEYINEIKRYCLWFDKVDPSVILEMPLINERVKKVREFRAKSEKIATQASANTPMLFQEIRQPSSDFIIIPSVSSENRHYIPIGFMSKEIIASNTVHIIPNASLYHFGILTSHVHMAWVRTVCGRLKSDYRYSGSVVYNNFPWPEVSDEAKAKISNLAMSIISARELYFGSSLAKMYDNRYLHLFPKLRDAHDNLDHAVMQLYGFSNYETESDIIASLFHLYRDITLQ